MRRSATAQRRDVRFIAQTNRARLSARSCARVVRSRVERRLRSRAGESDAPAFGLGPHARDVLGNQRRERRDGGSGRWRGAHSLAHGGYERGALRRGRAERDGERHAAHAPKHPVDDEPCDAAVAVEEGVQLEQTERGRCRCATDIDAHAREEPRERARPAGATGVIGVIGVESSEWSPIGTRAGLASARVQPGRPG